jgi:hypothetical protein
MTQIVKVQRPIMTNDPDQPWLMYDRERKHVTEVPDAIVPAYVKTAMREDYKAYFVGAWSSIVGWGLTERVSDNQGF